MGKIDADDLISRKQLIERIKMFTNISESYYHDTDVLIAEISHMPIAYDVEKVVAELEEEYDHWADVYNCNKDQYSDGTSDGLNFAIKIVMNGGKE